MPFAILFWILIYLLNGVLNGFLVGFCTLIQLSFDTVLPKLNRSIPEIKMIRI